MPPLLSVTRLSLTRRPVALRPRLAAGLPLSRHRSARAHVNHLSDSEAGDTYAVWPFLSRSRWASCMPGDYSLHANSGERRKGGLLRTPSTRSSRIREKTKFVAGFG